MPGTYIDDELARLREELAAVEASTARYLDFRSMNIAQAKIAKLQREIKALEAKRAQGR